MFTLTDKDTGITRFGVCLNFYRGVDRRAGPAAHLQVRLVLFLQLLRLANAGKQEEILEAAK